MILVLLLFFIKPLYADLNGSWIYCTVDKNFIELYLTTFSNEERVEYAFVGVGDKCQDITTKAKIVVITRWTYKVEGESLVLNLLSEKVAFLDREVAFNNKVKTYCSFKDLSKDCELDLRGDLSDLGSSTLQKTVKFKKTKELYLSDSPFPKLFKMDGGL